MVARVNKLASYNRVDAVTSKKQASFGRRAVFESKYNGFGYFTDGHDPLLELNRDLRILERQRKHCFKKRLSQYPSALMLTTMAITTTPKLQRL
ncbi:hypothetical protein ATERTT37_000285 [Aspergillus terreus]